MPVRFDLLRPTLIRRFDEPRPSAVDEPIPRHRILSVFKSRGINVSRLEIRGHVESLSSHLAAYHDVDIALDTFPYHGATTTCDALWMGVPVVSRAGDRHVSRVGVSLLSSVGLEQFIAADEPEYVSIAQSLAADLPALSSLRQTMRHRLRCSPLLDAKSFAAAMQAAVLRMRQLASGITGAE